MRTYAKVSVLCAAALAACTSAAGEDAGAPSAVPSGPSTAAPPTRDAAPSSLDALAWMAGCWESRAGDRVTLEMWSPPAGGLMVGASRTVAGGRARAWEHLRIHAVDEDHGGRIVYVAVPSGQAETAFRSTSVGSDGFVVENPEHDFPTRIAYRREGPDRMTARVEGPGEDGMRGFDVVFGRVACRG